MNPSPEANELAAVVLERLTPYLPRVAAPGDRRSTPGQRLYTLVADRLTALGETEALTELVRDPRNNSLVKRLLATAATDDAGYAAALTAAVAALPSVVDPDGAAGSAPPAARSAKSATRSAKSAAPSTEPPVGAAEPPTEPPVGAGNGRRPGRLAWIGLAAIVVLALAGFLIVRSTLNGLGEAGGLTAQSSCAEYRQAPPEERVAAIRQIGLAKGVSGADGPLVMAALDQLCDAQPAAKLGDLLARMDG